MLKRVLLLLAVLVVGVLAAVLLQPSTFHVERSITLAAPVDIPFGLVNDFHRWQFWSPWEAQDPKLRRGFDGPYVGPGASYTWSSDKVGSGKMTLLETRPYDSIRIQLEISKPLRADHTLTFTFQPVPEGVTVRWAMDGHHGLLGKAFSLFGGMDARVGGDFEKGLARIQELVDIEAKKRRERDARLKATPPSP